MSWWDYGIKGRDNDVMMKSGSVTQPLTGFDNINGYVSVGSLVLKETETPYTQLMLTTGQGTQIYFKMTPTKQTGVPLYFPTETGTVYSYTNTIMLKKGSTSLEFTGGSPLGNRVLGGYGSIYDCQYRTYGASGLFDGQKIRSLFYAYPRSKASGGGTQQVAMISSSAGLDFYIVGFPCVTEYGADSYVYNNPAAYIGRIPASALTNLFWFDPDADALQPSEYAQMQGNSIPSERPVDYTYTGTDIDFPSLPSGASVMGFGRMNIFHPTAAQLATALDILWSDATESTLETIIESCKKWWYKPEQYCVSLMLMPLNVSGDSKKIYFGKYDTLTNAPAIANQWQSVDCGTLDIPLKSNSAFDFSPHVKAMIYLPYIGFRPINVNEIMGGSIAVKYYVDMFTGSALCFVKVSNQNSNSSVLYTYECNVAQQIPITSENYNQVINSLITASLSVGTSMLGNAAVGAHVTGAGALDYASRFSAGLSGMGTPDVQTSGKLSSNTGALGAEYPYVVLHFPVQSVPSGFVNQNGYPSSVNVMLSNLTGYTEVEKIHLDIPGATQDELNEIQSLLKAGVIL